MLALFGRSWAKIWDIPRKDTLPTVPKPQPGCPVTRSMPFQPFRTTRVLKVRFWPLLDHFGPFWALLDQNLGHPPHRHTPNCVKTSTRMSCNSFHAILTVWDTRVLKVRFLPFLDHFSLFWVLLGQNWGLGTPPHI